MKPVVIFAATRWEILALRRALPTHGVRSVAGVRCLVGNSHGRTYWLVQTGVGPVRAGRSAEAVFAAQPMALAVSAGFACALTPAEIGTVLLGEAAVSVRQTPHWRAQEDRVRCDDAVTNGLSTAAARVGLTAVKGTVLSSESVLWRAEEKQAVARTTEAIGLDMESAALGNAAAGHGTPFAIVRTVSDGVDEDLPLDFNLFLRPTGWLSGCWALLSRPSSLGGLNRLRRQSRLAGTRLTAMVEAWSATGFEGCGTN